MKILIQTILFISLFPLIINAQDKADYSSFRGDSNVTFKTVNYIQNSSFCEYNIKHKPKPVQTYMLSPNNTSPENLLVMLSESTNDSDVMSLLLNGAKNSFVEKYIPLSKVDSVHYFLITEKLSFDFEGNHIALLKYFKIENGEQSKAYSIQLQKLNDSWYIIDNPDLSDLQFIIGHLKYKILYKFLEKGTSGEEAINEMAKKCLSGEGTLLYHKLYEMLKYELDNDTAFAAKWME